jgi:hypothetical protein
LFIERGPHRIDPVEELWRGNCHRAILPYCERGTDPFTPTGSLVDVWQGRRNNGASLRQRILHA